MLIKWLLSVLFLFLYCSYGVAGIDAPVGKCEGLAADIGSNEFVSIGNKKVFVGKSKLKYNVDDYNLWVSSVDIDNDSKNDLVALDWHPRGNKNFYLAIYYWSDNGELIEDKRRLKKYLLGQSLSIRHKSGAQAMIPEALSFVMEDGEKIEESFIGYHQIKIIYFDGEPYVLAEKGSGVVMSRLLFRFDKKDKRLKLQCKIGN